MGIHFIKGTDASKVDKVTGVTEDNIWVSDGAGGLKDSSLAVADIGDSLPVATITQAQDPTNSTTVLSPERGHELVAPIANPKALSQGIHLTAASSGSNGIQVADNTDINFGTGDFTLVWIGSLPDWTPSENVSLIAKWENSVFTGFGLTIKTTGALMCFLNENIESTTTPSISNGIISSICAVVRRETPLLAGSVTFYVNGAQLGDVVTLPIDASPSAINNLETLHICGNDVAKRFASTTLAAYVYNYALSADQVLDLYRNGVAFADKDGSMTPVYESDFSAGVDSWGATQGTVTGNIDGIGGEDDCLRFYASADTGTHDPYSGVILSSYVGKNVRIAGKVFIANSGGSTYLDGVKIILGLSTDSGGQVVTTVGAWVDFSFEQLVPSAYTRVYAWVRKSGSYSFTGANTATDDVLYFKNVTATPIGTTLRLEPENIQPTPGQWLDAANGHHALMPAAGATLIRPKDTFRYQNVLTWTASSAAQPIAGITQDPVITSDHVITKIYTRPTELTSVQNITIGDESDPDRYMAAASPGSLNSVTPQTPTATPSPDGTNYQLLVTPAGAATMTVEVIIEGIII